MRYPILLIASLWLAALPNAMADWAQWRGPNQTGHLARGTRAPDQLPASPKVVWRIPVGEGNGSPVVAGNKVFYLDAREDREVVHAVSTRTGKESWSADLDQAFKDNITKAGPRSTPVVHDGLVYVQSCRGQFKCLKASNGKTVWEANFTREFQAPFYGERGKAKGASRHGNTASPVVVGEHIFIAAGGTNGAGIVCLNRKTGKERWRSQSDTPGYGSVLHTKLAGRDQLVHFSSAGVFGLDPRDGSLLWREPETTTFGRHVITPLVRENLVVISTHQTGIRGLRLEPAANGYSVDPAWVNKGSAINFASPVAVGDHLYGVGPRQNVICVNLDTGKEQWSQKGLLKGNAGNAYAGLIAWGDTILMLTDGGTLILFEASPEAYRERGRAQVCGVNWCNPAIDDGQLYLRDQNALYRLELE